MKISKVQIENFRSIKNSTLTFEEITAIVGENNAGKSAILRALNCFFNYGYEEKSFIDCTHQHLPRTVTRITITFSEVNDKDKYQQYLSDNDEMLIQFTYTYSETKKGRKLYCLNKASKITLEADIFLDKLKEDIDYVYIPANRGSRDFEWTDSSIFARLIKRYLENYTKKRDNLSNNAAQAGEKIRSQVLDKLAKELSQLNMYDSIGTYEIGYSQDIDYSLFLTKLKLFINNGLIHSLPVSEYGSGIKSLTVIALHRMLANLNGVSIVLGIEEPETNLHPQAQRILIDSLKGQRQNCETQAIFTTHSTVIVDELKHDNIILVRRENDSKRKFISVTTQIASSFWQDHNIMEFKHHRFFYYKNSDFFFAKFVILVESTTDAGVIEKLVKPKIGNKSFYVSIVNIDGIKNLKYPYFLLKDLNIPFVAVVDRDLFSGYINGKLDKSRDPESSLPIYSTKLGRNTVIRSIFDTKDKVSVAENVLKLSYTKLFDFMKHYDLLSMNYCLEMDLVKSEAAFELYCDHFGLVGEKRCNKTLLEEKKDAIKESSLIFKIMDVLEPSEYPYSYKKIRTEIVRRIETDITF